MAVAITTITAFFPQRVHFFIRLRMCNARSADTWRIRSWIHAKARSARPSGAGAKCLGCEKRFTTYERIDEVPYMVIKKDGRREKFDRQKVLSGLLKAGEKRPISMGKLAAMVDQVEAKLTDSPDREISTIEIGEQLLMDGLRDLDKIAYVRFASVYRDFQDEEAFFQRA